MLYIWEGMATVKPLTNSTDGSESDNSTHQYLMIFNHTGTGFEKHDITEINFS